MCINLESSTGRVGVDTLVASQCPGLRRKKVWELEHRLHCSIAGTCFTLGEMRRFCRKGQLIPRGLVSDYDLHINFVAMLADAETARPAAKYLDRKYKATIQHFDQADSPNDLKLRWNEAVSQGEIAAAFWSILTHPYVSETLLFEVYGEVHMLSHLSGASVRIDMQALIQLRRRLPELEKEIDQSRVALLSRTCQKNKMIETLNKRLNKALQNERKFQKAEKEIKSLESEETLRHLRSQVETYASKLKNSNVRANRAEADAAKQKKLAEVSNVRNTQVESQLVELRAEQSALEIALEGALSAQHSSSEKRDACKKVDLAGRSILYVGGRNRLCAHFRTLVEQQNGYFIHHDGGREESTQRLDALLNQVDAVLCPLDCVSHDAVHRIKRGCKRYGKYLMLLSQSSLSAFTKGIHEYSRGSSVAH
ncbi:MAG: DUF2325 domain-containing protein [Gammaproteobacteria bacterium]|nr:DUF2325 domain-containing protein [Gammaproteobacteria bacterium]